MKKKKPTCLACWRLSQLNGERVTCAACVVRALRVRRG